MLNKITESDSRYDHLEKMDVRKLLVSINQEDKTISYAVEKIIPQIEKLVKVIVQKIRKGGRLFYIGAGTSGRLGIVDASECPPTYGVPHGLVIGLIAGGDKAIRKAIEFAEDDTQQGWKDIKKEKINSKDVVIGITASGTTPYVVGAIKKCNQNNIITGCITCNPKSPIALVAKYPIIVIVGAEFVTGSTRMKSGTAQKLILNMISSAVMIKLGKVKGNKMVDMQLTNNKLIERGTKIISRELKLPYHKAKKLLLKYGGVRKAITSTKS
ncbi:MAG: N-acetylmuramic acid 6-phosphate etherase [Bacteroidota bacterium]